MAVRISKDDFEKQVLQSEKPVIVDFYSDSCVACKKLSPVLADAEEEYEDRIAVFKVNTNYDMELAQEYGVLANPTLLFIADGEVKGRKRGALSPAELKDWIEAYI